MISINWVLGALNGAYLSCFQAPEKLTKYRD
jgi:hypothetical protein